jgi:hypothetical protein
VRSSRQPGFGRFIPLQLIAENTSSSIAFMPQKVTNRDDGWKGEATAILKIRGLIDSGQAQRFRRTVAKLDGVLRVNVNYILDSVTVKYDADKPTPTQIKKKLALRNHKPVIHLSNPGGNRRQDEHVADRKLPSQMMRPGDSQGWGAGSSGSLATPSGLAGSSR